MIKAKSLASSLTMSPLLPKFLKIDEQKLSQIVYNTVNNAVKHTQSGQVKGIFEWHINCSPEEALQKIESEYHYNTPTSLVESTAAPSEMPSACSGILAIKIIDTGVGMTNE